MPPFTEPSRSANRTKRGPQGYDCQACGQRLMWQDFHSYESCILYKLDHSTSTLTTGDQAHIMRAGIEVMRQRVAKRELP